MEISDDAQMLLVRSKKDTKVRSLDRIQSNNFLVDQVIFERRDINQDLEYISSVKQDLISKYNFRPSWLMHINEKSRIKKLLKPRNIKKVLIAKNSRGEHSEFAAKAAIDIICGNSLLREVNGSLWEDRVKMPAQDDIKYTHEAKLNSLEFGESGCGYFFGIFSLFSCNNWRSNSSSDNNNKYKSLENIISN